MNQNPFFVHLRQAYTGMDLRNKRIATYIVMLTLNLTHNEPTMTPEAKNVKLKSVLFSITSGTFVLEKPFCDLDLATCDNVMRMWEAQP